MKFLIFHSCLHVRDLFRWEITRSIFYVFFNSRYLFAILILLLEWKWKSCSISHIRLFVTHGLQPSRLLCPWNSPGKNTEVDRHSLLQGFSWPRDRTQIPHIAGRFFIFRATKEDQNVGHTYKFIFSCKKIFLLPLNVF